MTLMNRTLGPFFFPSILWQTQSASIHLTFDDGPHPSATPEVLEMLDRHKAQATFFFLGENAVKHPELVRRVALAGHVVGNHGLEHKSFFLRKRSYQAHQIGEGARVLEEILGGRPRAFRPPFGHFDWATLAACADADLQLVMWDVDSHDFIRRPPQKVINDVLRLARGGSIVLFHDSELTAGRVKSYLGPILGQLADRGHSLSVLPL